MPIYVYNINETSKKSSERMKGNKYSPDCPFRMLVNGSSNSGKTNMVINLMLGKKLQCIFFNFAVSGIASIMILPKSHLVDFWRILLVLKVSM